MMRRRWTPTVSATVALVLLSLIFGRAPGAGRESVAEALRDFPAMFAFQLVAGILVSAGLGWLSRRAGFSRMVGELVGGILTGFFLSDLIPFHVGALQGFGWVGVLLIVFESGLTVDPSAMWHWGRKVISIGVIGVIVPFICGMVVYRPLMSAGLTPEQQWIALAYGGLIISISSMAVMTRPFRDAGLHQTELGRMILAAFVLNEILGMGVYGIVNGLAQARGEALLETARDLGLSLAFMAGSVAVSRYTRRWFGLFRDSGLVLLSMRLAVAILFGLITDRLGLTALVGFFFAGVVSGHARNVEQSVMYSRIEPLFQVIHWAMVPIYFAAVGLSLDLRQSLSLNSVMWLSVWALLLKYWGARLGARDLGPAERSLVGWAFSPGGVPCFVAAFAAQSLGIFSPQEVTNTVLAVLIGVLVFPWGLRSALRDVEASQPSEGWDPDRALSHYVPDWGVVDIEDDDGRRGVETLQSTVRRLCRQLPTKRHLNIPEGLLIERIFEQEPPAIVTTEGGIGLVFSRFLRLKRPVILIGRPRQSVLGATKGERIGLIILVLTSQGEGGVERSGQQLQVQRRLMKVLMDEERRKLLLAPGRGPAFGAAVRRAFR